MEGGNSLRSGADGGKRRVTYLYDPEVGSISYGEDHDMKPSRIQMTHDLVSHYRLLPKMEVLRPAPGHSSDGVVTRYHSEEYVSFLKRVTPDSQDEFVEQLKLYELGNNDCPVFDKLYKFCCISAGGSVGGAIELNRGSCDIAINWAGGLHHAKKCHAAGFCYINDCVLAILELLDCNQRVLYIDIDVHHGDGVEEAFCTTDRVMTVSFHQYGHGFFPKTGAAGDIGKGKGKHYALNVPLSSGIDDESFLSLFVPIMTKVMERFQPEAVVLQCGADSLAGDEIGGFNLSSKGHGQCVRFMRSFNVPMLIVGGGGYSEGNAPRTWCYESALLLGEELDENLPHSEKFGPDFTLHVPSGNMKNKNSKKRLDELRENALEHLSKLPHAPSVPFSERPPPGAEHYINDKGHLDRRERGDAVHGDLSDSDSEDHDERRHRKQGVITSEPAFGRRPPSQSLARKQPRALGTGSLGGIRKAERFGEVPSKIEIRIPTWHLTSVPKIWCGPNDNLGIRTQQDCEFASNVVHFYIGARQVFEPQLSDLPRLSCMPIESVTTGMYLNSIAGKGRAAQLEFIRQVKAVIRSELQQKRDADSKVESFAESNPGEAHQAGLVAAASAEVPTEAQASQALAPRTAEYMSEHPFVASFELGSDTPGCVPTLRSTLERRVDSLDPPPLYHSTAQPLKRKRFNRSRRSSWGALAKNSRGELSQGNKHSITKAPFQAKTRPPASSTPTKRQTQPRAAASPFRASPGDETMLQTKPLKTGLTPPTPTLRSSRKGREIQPAWPEKLNFPSRHLRTENTSLPEEKDQQKLVSPTKGQSDPSGNVEEENTRLAIVGSQVKQQPSFSFNSKRPSRLRGLKNLGNTCYMNVIIQNLFNLPIFVNGMEQFFGQNASEGSESFPDIESIYGALLKVFRDLRRAGTSDAVDPTVLKDAFAMQQDTFRGFTQQDAHEFFCSLIDHVLEDVSSALKEQDSMETDRPRLETVCPTTQNFSCSVRNNLTCAGCGNVSSVEETYRDFSLALPEDERTDESMNCSLESLLNLNFQESPRSRKCEKCGIKDTKMKTQILKLPHVLVLQLKRLQMDLDIACRKVSAPVKFTSRLDIGPWCAQDGQKFWSPSTRTSENDPRPSSEGNMDCDLASSYESESQELPSSPKASSYGTDMSTCYRLHGVVHHLGHDAFGGHFVADILDPEAGRWFSVNDEVVTEVSEETVFAKERDAYMFFYVREPAGSNACDCAVATKQVRQKITLKEEN